MWGSGSIRTKPVKDWDSRNGINYRPPRVQCVRERGGARAGQRGGGGETKRAQSDNHNWLKRSKVVRGGE